MSAPVIAPARIRPFPPRNSARTAAARVDRGRAACRRGPAAAERCLPHVARHFGRQAEPHPHAPPAVRAPSTPARCWPISARPDPQPPRRSFRQDVARLPVSIIAPAASARLPAPAERLARRARPPSASSFPRGARAVPGDHSAMPPRGTSSSRSNRDSNEAPSSPAKGGVIASATAAAAPARSSSGIGAPPRRKPGSRTTRPAWLPPVPKMRATPVQRQPQRCSGRGGHQHALRAGIQEQADRLPGQARRHHRVAFDQPQRQFGDHARERRAPRRRDGSASRPRQEAGNPSSWPTAQPVTACG